MTTRLLSTFIEEDCTPPERARLLEAFARWEGRQQPVRQHLTFNRFEFKFDAEEESIVIDDMLDGTENGSEKISADELKASLRQ